MLDGSNIRKSGRLPGMVKFTVSLRGPANSDSELNFQMGIARAVADIDWPDIKSVNM